MAIDAVLLVSFGGPDGPDDVMPFLQNVLRGRPVPPERMGQVAAHYHAFGGVSPINGHNRRLLDAIKLRLAERGNPQPLYWGNRNWHPLLTDTVRTMGEDGILRAAAFVTSAFSSYSGCRQYLDDIAAARASVGDHAPTIVKLPPFFDRDGFVWPFAEWLRRARHQAGMRAPVIMTAHSIPVAQAERCDYENQLRQAAALVADKAGEPGGSWTLAFQSRSGPSTQPWLGPDISDAIRDLPAATPAVIVVPIGFVSDHMEVVYDLDRQAADVARSRSMRFVRCPTPGTHPAFVEMICDLVDEVDRSGAETTCPCSTGCPASSAR